MEMYSTELPDSVLRDAVEFTGHYLIGFVKPGTDGGGADAKLAGSGTLVRTGKVCGILTAQHVAKNLPTKGEIGIILPRGIDTPAYPGNPTILGERLRIVAFPRGKRDSSGPDLALIILSPLDAARIGAIKSFYNLDYWRSSVLSDQRDPNHHAFGLSGFPYVLVSDASPQRGFRRVKVFKGLLFLTFIDRIKVGKGFDYADVNVSYGGRADDPPRNFGGFSGGGLWLIELKGTTKEAVKMSRCTLYGVAFYQTKIVRSRRRIRCHWRRSIYDRLLRKIGKTVRARK